MADPRTRGWVSIHAEECKGCGLCIAVCPRGTLRWTSAPEAPTPQLRADKCDLCRGYQESACVRDCPTQALLRLPADERLRDLNEALYHEVVGRYFEAGGSDQAP